MRAYKCDRCGKYYQCVETLIYIAENKDGRKDLCQDCQNKLEKWFYNEREDKREDEQR